MSADLEWWKRRAMKRYREVQRLRAKLAAVQTALDAHADCWPDDWCQELATDVRAAIDGVPRD